MVVASEPGADGALTPATAQPAGGHPLGRRRLLGWLLGGAAATFAAAFALPAVALKSLSVPKVGITRGDALVLATAMSGLAAGQPQRLAAPGCQPTSALSVQA